MPSAIRQYAALALALVACGLLAVAEFTPLYSIRVITVTVEETSTGSHHGYALLVIALAAAAMALGATRGRSRPAAFALLALAVASLAVVLAVDLPVVDEEGLYGRDFEQARAQAEIGFRLSTAGSILLLLSAVTILVLGEHRPAAGRRRERRGQGAEAGDSA